MEKQEKKENGKKKIEIKPRRQKNYNKDVELLVQNEENPVQIRRGIAQNRKREEYKKEDYKNAYTPFQTTNNMKKLYEDVQSMKKQLYGDQDPGFSKAWQDANDDADISQKEKEFLEAHFTKNGLKNLKMIVLNKLLAGVMTPDEFFQYQTSSAADKKRMLLALAVDFPFLGALLGKVAPYIASKAYDYLKPKVAQIGKSLLQTGVKKLESTGIGKELAKMNAYTDAKKAFNLDPEEIKNPITDLPPNFNGPTSGLLIKPMTRVVSASDVNIKALQSSFWPENEAYRMSLPNNNNFSATLQASAYLTVPVTNSLGNLFVAITPQMITHSSIFAWTFNAAGAIISAPGLSVTYGGPLNNLLSNFQGIRVSGLSITLMNNIAPLNRSGTISIAVTDKTRLSTTSPTFYNMAMSMVFAQSSYSTDSYTALYVPDEEDEWDLFLAGVPPTQVSSDILIAVEGSVPNVTPYKLLVTYTVEYTPSDLSRPLVTVGRAPVAPSTLAAAQLMLKHYNSILLADANRRGNFFRLLESKYGEFITIDDLSKELSSVFEGLSAPTYISTGTVIGPTTSTFSSNVGHGTSTAVRSSRKKQTKSELLEGNKQSRSRSISPVVKSDTPDFISVSFNTIVSQLTMQLLQAQLNVVQEDKDLIVTDGTSIFHLSYGPQAILFEAITERITKDNWSQSLWTIIQSWYDMPGKQVGNMDYVDLKNYTAEIQFADSALILATMRPVVSANATNTKHPTPVSTRKA